MKYRPTLTCDTGKPPANVTWTSSDADIAKITDPNGTVRMTGKGKVTITAHYTGNDGNLRTSSTTLTVCRTVFDLLFAKITALLKRWF